MKTRSPGYAYELGDGTLLDFQTGGATTEEVIRVLIERLGVQYSKVPSMENFLARKALADAIRWLEKREGKRLSLGVLGTDQPHVFPAPTVSDSHTTQ